jgi:hypothetical protein
MRYRFSILGIKRHEGRGSSDELRNINSLSGLRLALLVLSCAVVFSIKASALGATNARPRRVLILDSFARDVAPFNAGA